MNISRKTLKENAKAIIKSNNTLLIAGIVFGIANVILTFLSEKVVEIPAIGALLSIAFSLVTVVLSLQLEKVSVDATNNKEINFTDFGKLKKAVFTTLWTMFYLLPGLALVFVGAFVLGIGIAVAGVGALGMSADVIMGAGGTAIVAALIMIAGLVVTIVLSYAYAFTTIMVYDDKHDSLSAKEIAKECKNITLGHRMDLFVLDLSFFGWALLAGFIGVIPFIGSLLSTVATGVLTVYITLAQIQFFKAIVGNDIIDMNKEI